MFSRKTFYIMRVKDIVNLTFYSAQFAYLLAHLNLRRIVSRCKISAKFSIRLETLKVIQTLLILNLLLLHPFIFILSSSSFRSSLHLFLIILLTFYSSLHSLNNFPKLFCSFIFLKTFSLNFHYAFLFIFAV